MHSPWPRRRSLRNLPYFPWCSCTQRAPSLTPIRAGFGGYYTLTQAPKPPARYACFYLTISSLPTTYSNCSMMGVGKVEFDIRGESRRSVRKRRRRSHVQQRKLAHPAPQLNKSSEL